jgi:hypothetical protein
VTTDDRTFLLNLRRQLLSLAGEIDKRLTQPAPQADRRN